MDKAKLVAWLQKLAAAVNCEPKELTIEVYLEELSRWLLSDAEWEELRQRAVMSHRVPRCLPMLPDLADIRDEILQEARIRADNRHLALIRKGSHSPMPADVRWQIERLEKGKL